MMGFIARVITAKATRQEMHFEEEPVYHMCQGPSSKNPTTLKFIGRFHDL